MARTPTDIRAMARSHGPSMMRVLASIARQKTAPASARVAAAVAVLDRGYGKAEQSVDTKSDLQITIRQILDAPQPKLVVGKTIDHMQHTVSGMPASDNPKGAPSPKRDAD